MTNHLAAELRAIIQDAVDTEAHPVILERLLRLAEHVEQVADPVEVDASTELTASFGLEPDQEIRDRALERAVELAVCEIHLPATRSGEVLDLAETFAAYIRTGERPA